MAIVKEQEVPTTDNEDNLDPPVEFIKQYRRLLSEGIDHPKLEAGYEIITASKKESRPAQRSRWRYYNKPENEAWREVFKKCLACWRTYADTDAEEDTCRSAGSKHYVKPWHYVPGAILTWFNSFMKKCLDWQVTHPGEIYPTCEDLIPIPQIFEYCPGDTVAFTFQNGNTPFIDSTDCGTPIGTLEIEIPFQNENPPQTCTVHFKDSDGRRGCAYGTQKPLDQCCCATTPPVEILYTTLAMQCSESQGFSVDPDYPGCPPYNWTLSGGGSLSANTGDSTTYTAPDTNPSCTLNPTITLQDSCGSSRSIQLAVNCYTIATSAFKEWACTTGADGSSWCASRWGYPSVNTRNWYYFPNYYLCNGTFLSAGPGNNAMACKGPVLDCCGYFHLAKIDDYCDCLTGYQFCTGALGNCMKRKFTMECGDTEDLRTAAMKAAGCCPINPLTGLPF